jgi:hypothetical protein
MASYRACGSLQARVDAVPAGSTLDLTGCRVTGGATINKPLRINGGLVTAPERSFGIRVTSSDVSIQDLTVVGAQSATYESDEIGIRVEGTTTPVRGLVLEGCWLSHLGYGGILLEHVEGFTLSQNQISDVVYAGIMVLSGRSGILTGNTVQRVGVRGSEANGGNAYGIALSRAESDLVAAPPTSDMQVAGNTVTDVPTWHAFDGHGVSGVEWRGNFASASRFGLFITGSVASGATVRSQDNQVLGNTIIAPSKADGYAIVSVYSNGGAIANNTVVGWPPGHEILTTSAGAPDAAAQGLSVGSNSVQP